MNVGETLDIIIGSWKMDLADSYNWGNVSTQIGTAVNSNSGLASAIESIKSSTEAAIEKTIHTYENTNH